MNLYIFVMFSSSDMVCRRMNTATIWYRSLKIHFYLGMSFGTQIRTAIIITTWENYDIFFFQIFFVTKVNVLKIVCGWNCEFTTIWRFIHIFVIYHNTRVVSIWQKDFMLDEMWFKMKCTREWHTNTIGHELYIYRQFHFISLTSCPLQSQVGKISLHL